jgi:hypothetical protein
MAGFLCAVAGGGLRAFRQINAPKTAIVSGGSAFARWQTQFMPGTERRAARTRRRRCGALSSREARIYSARRAITCLGRSAVGFLANIPDICCKNRLAAHPDPSAAHPRE